MHRQRRSSIRAALSCLIGLSTAGCGPGKSALAPPEPPTVGVVHPKATSFRITKEFTGRLVTKDPVKVIPQVTGRLVAREFKDGDLVEEGKTVLFRIDPVLFQADVDKAKADLARAKGDIANWKAQIKRDKSELDRVNKAAPGSVSETELEKALATVQVDEAQLEVSKANELAADAAIVKAKENLKYCTVYAPASGRVGLALAAPGTLVDAYKTELVSVYPIDPVYAVWEVDELTSLWYRDQIRTRKLDDPRTTPLHCTIKLKDEKSFSTDPKDRTRNSAVDYIDPEIVRGTGTRTLRATFENPPTKGPKGEVIPPLLSAGDSVRVRLTAGAPRPVLTVPEGAVFNQQRKLYVYVVADGKAQLDGLVEVNRRASATATTGLDEADAVIVDNLLRVRPGIPVTVK
jgi:membrane fusion protein, multidrug efflux system